MYQNRAAKFHHFESVFAYAGMKSPTQSPFLYISGFGASAGDSTAEKHFVSSANKEIPKDGEDIEDGRSFT